MAKDFNKPVTTDLYTAILTDIRDMLSVLGRMQTQEASNIPTDAVRWNESNKRFEKYNGASWVALQPTASTSQEGLVTMVNNYTTNSQSAATAAALRNAYNALNAAKAESFSDLSGSATAGQLPALSGLNGSLNTSQINYASAPSNHIQAGNTFLLNGDYNGSSFDLSVNMPASTWESVGPTGSGADNIWSELNVLPSSARILICTADLLVSPAAGTENCNTGLRATSGDIGSPSNTNDNLLAYLEAHNFSTGSATQAIKKYSQIYIPLSSAQTFKAYWFEAGNSTDIKLTYRGFIVD